MVIVSDWTVPDLVNELSTVCVDMVNAGCRLSLEVRVLHHALDVASWQYLLQNHVLDTLTVVMVTGFLAPKLEVAVTNHSDPASQPRPCVDKCSPSWLLLILKIICVRYAIFIPFPI